MHGASIFVSESSPVDSGIEDFRVIDSPTPRNVCPSFIVPNSRHSFIQNKFSQINQTYQRISEQNRIQYKQINSELKKPDNLQPEGFVARPTQETKNLQEKAHRSKGNAVRKVTCDLLDTYSRIHQFNFNQFTPQFNPNTSSTNQTKMQTNKNIGKIRLRREGVFNNGFDNQHHDYVIVEGEVICDRYVVQKLIGKGSFGQVVKAYDRLDQTYYAIKIIKNRKAFSQQGKVEICLLNLLRTRDPLDQYGTVTLKTHFEWQGHLCLVFELLGQNLYEVLRRTSYEGLSLSIVRIIAHQILMTLNYLSSSDLNIIHCDLKPENILLCWGEKWMVKMVDFGSSCQLGKRVYSYIQSRFYRAPEVVLGLEYDLAIDMWSLGCVLMELLTGDPLFCGLNEHDQLCKVVEILGSPPDSMIESSSKCDKFFKRFGDVYVARPSPNTHSRSHKRNKAASNPNRAKSLEKLVYDSMVEHSASTRPYHASPTSLSDQDYLYFLDLIRKLLEYQPSRRLKPLQALQHPFFHPEMRQVNLSWPMWMNSEGNYSYAKRNETFPISNWNYMEPKNTTTQLNIMEQSKNPFLSSLRVESEAAPAACPTWNMFSNVVNSNNATSLFQRPPSPVATVNLPRLSKVIDEQSPNTGRRNVARPASSGSDSSGSSHSSDRRKNLERLNNLLSNLQLQQENLVKKKQENSHKNLSKAKSVDSGAISSAQAEKQLKEIIEHSKCSNILHASPTSFNNNNSRAKVEEEPVASSSLDEFGNVIYSSRNSACVEKSFNPYEEINNLDPNRLSVILTKMKSYRTCDKLTLSSNTSCASLISTSSSSEQVNSCGAKSNKNTTRKKLGNNSTDSFKNMHSNSVDLPATNNASKVENTNFPRTSSYGNFILGSFMDDKEPPDEANATSLLNMCDDQYEKHFPKLLKG